MGCRAVDMRVGKVEVVALAVESELGNRMDGDCTCQQLIVRKRTDLDDGEGEEKLLLLYFGCKDFHTFLNVVFEKVGDVGSFKT